MKGQKGKMIFVCALAAAAGLAAGILAASAAIPGDGAVKTTSGTSGTANPENTLTAQIIQEFPAYEYDPGVRPDMDVLTASWYGDAETVRNSIVSARTAAAENRIVNARDDVILAITKLGSLSRYLKYRDSLSVTVGDTVYGAYVEDGDSPIGGGKGYKNIITSGDYTVRNFKELSDACGKAKSGEVIFIPSGVTIDVSREEKTSEGYNIVLGEGVTLASDRGYVREDGSVSTGAMIKGHGAGETITTNLILCKSGSRLTGLAVQGPDPNRHVEHHTRCYKPDGSFDLTVFYKLPVTTGIAVKGDGAEIDNCEISGFCHTAIDLTGFDVHVHHNYIHHNQIKGNGYGVCFERAGGVVEYNLFNFNRHSIAGGGHPESWYIARYNVDMGDVLNHVYDMHGNGGVKNGKNIAGRFIEMYNNTFLPDDYPYCVRGVPEEYYKFFRNVVMGTKDKYDFSILRGERVEIYDNIFGIEEKTVVK